MKVDLETHYSEQRSSIRVVASSSADLRKKEVQSMNQSKIRDFFK